MNSYSSRDKIERNIKENKSYIVGKSFREFFNILYRTQFHEYIGFFFLTIHRRKVYIKENTHEKKKDYFINQISKKRLYHNSIFGGQLNRITYREIYNISL